MAHLTLSPGNALYHEYTAPARDGAVTYVFVNALTGNTGAWESVIAPNLREQGFGTLSYNFRGQDDSPFETGTALTPDLIVDDLCALLREVAPVRPVLVGLVAFAAGFTGDGIWHTVFGVETGIDALLSPTHLLLLYGLVLVLAAPLQAVLRTGGSVWIATASVTILALLSAFFTSFVRPFGKSWALEIGFDPRSGNDLSAAWMVGGVLLATVIMAVSATYLLQRFDRLPFGTLTILWAVPAILEAIALSSTIRSAAAAGIAGGLAADVLLRQLKGSPRFTWGLAVTVGSVVTWSMWTLAQRVWLGPVDVPAEIWTGQIVMSAFVAMGVVMLATPPSTYAQPRI